MIEAQAAHPQVDAVVERLLRLLHRCLDSSLNLASCARAETGDRRFGKSDQGGRAGSASARTLLSLVGAGGRAVLGRAVLKPRVVQNAVAARALRRISQRIIECAHLLGRACALARSRTDFLNPDLRESVTRHGRRTRRTRAAAKDVRSGGSGGRRREETHCLAMGGAVTVPGEGGTILAVEHPELSSVLWWTPGGRSGVGVLFRSRAAVEHIEFYTCVSSSDKHLQGSPSRSIQIHCCEDHLGSGSQPMPSTMRASSRTRPFVSIDCTTYCLTLPDTA